MCMLASWRRTQRPEKFYFLELSSLPELEVHHLFLRLSDKEVLMLLFFCPPHPRCWEDGCTPLIFCITPAQVFMFVWTLLLQDGWTFSSKKQCDDFTLVTNDIAVSHKNSFDEHSAFILREVSPGNIGKKTNSWRSNRQFFLVTDFIFKRIWLYSF